MELQTPSFNRISAWFWVFSFLIPFATNAQNTKSSREQEGKVVWGLEQINLDTLAYGKSEGVDALAESFRYLRDKMSPEEQREFKGWNINLHAADGERSKKRNEKRVAQYLKHVEATSKYFFVLVLEWNKEHLLNELDVQISLPETTPVFQEFSKKQVTLMIKVMLKESLSSAGLLVAPKPK